MSARAKSRAHELPRAFNRQTVWRRILIVAAGPVANFLLAIVLYWLLVHDRRAGREADAG